MENSSPCWPITPATPPRKPQFHQISGDWPGFAADIIEQNHPDAVALIAIGCGADANPSPRGTHEQAKQHGQAVAAEVERLLATAKNGQQKATATELRRIDPGVECRMSFVDLPLGPLPSREEWEERATQPGHAGVHARQFLELINAGKPVPTTIPNYPVQTWCFGRDMAMVFLGGEVVVDYAIRMNDMFDTDRLWINAYSNDVPCYIASKRILREGGYEVDRSMIYYARPTRLAPEAEDVICDTVQKLLPHQFYSEQLKAQFPAPKSPEESLSCVTGRPGVEVELVAAEPLIRDPVAFEWDIQGRLWVVEMGDYPLNRSETGITLPGGRSVETSAVGGGRIRVLEDTNSDGRYDKATTFLDNLNFPTGIHRWRNGILVTAAPDILYAEDKDGDLKADIRRILYTGFGEGNQQHRVNGLRWGLDGWLHIANGDSDGQITVVDSLRQAAKSQATNVFPLYRSQTGLVFRGQTGSISGRDARIRPDEGILDPTFGRTQFGRERDDWGNWFGNNNSNPLWHYIGEDRWFRDAFVSPARTRIPVPDVPGAAPVYPTSRTLARFNDFDKANRFTSACGSMIYRDTVLGDEFYGNAFTGEPVHNLVSRLVLEPDGITFRGRRADDERNSEFFAPATTGRAR